MKLKRVLLTGDDGYNAVGIRLIIRALKEKYDISVAATKHQQSGVGGKISLSTGGTWEEGEIEGVPALIVDGTPADCMELSYGYYKEKFDILISGINLGANVSTAVISSGTFGAAVRGLAVGAAPRAVILSWDAPVALWYKDHSEAEDIASYGQYPANVLQSLFELIEENEFWGARMLNINFPVKPSQEVHFTHFLNHSPSYYSYPIHMDPVTHTFDYSGQRINATSEDLKADAMVVHHGKISISPCRTDFLSESLYEMHKDTQLKLEKKI